MMLATDKVDQTLFGHGVGNCWPACIATITGIPLEEIPNFCVLYGDQHGAEALKWLRPRGFALWEVPMKGDDLTWVGKLVPDVPWIATGRNVNSVMHCCVYIGTKLWHDPNPTRERLSQGLMEVEWGTFFLKTRYR